MDISIIQTTTKQIGQSLSKNSPVILTALGVAGLIGTVILAVKATPKAVEILEEEDRYRATEINDPKYDLPIDAVDTFELTWRCYIPTALMGATTIACIVASNHISQRRHAAVVSLLTVVESTLREYQAKVVETMGDKKEEKLRGEIAQDTLNKNPIQPGSIIVTGKGDSLCFDSFSKRYFKSDVNKIERIMNEFNRRLNIEGFLPINDLYYELGLEPIELGDVFGWMAERELLDIRFSAKLIDGADPCIVVNYNVYQCSHF